ncbi:MAG: phosphoribosylglycinamide formyltransferase [Ignavibacteria bacterium]|nr:phosphoribosylglycinamide formyltransferase [Ignavibacteria bacterium]
MSLNLCVLVSGKGSNLKAIIRASASGKIKSKIKLVITNKLTSGAFDICNREGIRCVYMAEENFSSRSKYINEFLRYLRKYKIDLILLAGYLRKLPEEIVKKYRNRILNIHPSLLPSFGGKGMYGLNVHRAVIDSGVKISGVTVHIVTETYDSGPIVMQKAVIVKDDDTPESLSLRTKKAEHILYPKVISLFESKKIKVKNQRVSFV